MEGVTGLTLVLSCTVFGLIACLVVFLVLVPSKNVKDPRKNPPATQNPTKSKPIEPIDPNEEPDGDFDEAPVPGDPTKTKQCWRRSPAAIAKVPGHVRVCRLVPIRSPGPNPKAPAKMTPAKAPVSALTISNKSPVTTSAVIKQEIQIQNDSNKPLSGPISTVSAVSQSPVVVNTSNGGRAYEYLAPSIIDTKRIEQMFTPFPVKLLIDYKGIRIDTRPLNTFKGYQMKELQSRPANITLADGSTLTQMSFGPNVLKNPSGDGLDIFGSTSILGDVDINVFGFISDVNILNDQAALERVVQGLKATMEQMQDDMYRVSKGKFRITRVNCALIGLTSLFGKYDTGMGYSIKEYNLQHACGDPETFVIEQAITYASARYGWDLSYARHNLAFLLTNAPSCSAVIGLASSSCRFKCTARYSGFAGHLAPILKGSKVEGHMRTTIVHEFCHMMGLLHAGRYSVKYEEYNDPYSLMGSSTIILPVDHVPDMNSLNLFMLGWMDNVQVVNLDSIDGQGIQVTLRDDPYTCIMLVCPVILAYPEGKLYTGSLSYPVLCLSIRRLRDKQAECCIHSFVRKDVKETPNDWTVKSMNTILKDKIGINKSSASISLFAMPKPDKIDDLLNPPYIMAYNTTFKKMKLGDNPDITAIARSLGLSQVTRNNATVSIDLLNGPYSGQGDMQLSIKKTSST